MIEIPRVVEANLNIKMHANQRIINENPARYKVIKAGKRFGKTYWALYALCKNAGLIPNEVFWAIFPSYGMAKRIAWHHLQWILPRAFIKRTLETELTIELINGSRIQLVGADNEEALRGPRLGGVVFDEAAYVKENVWGSIISGQLLGSKTSFAYFISSPNNKGRNWFSNFWDSAKARQDAGDKDWAAYYFTISDNPTFTAEEVEKQRQQVSDDLWDLEYLAKESALSGTLYWEFDTTKHVGEYDGTVDLRARSWDWGISHPTVALYATIDKKKPMLYIYDEFFKSEMVIREICEANHKIADPKTIDREIMDPSSNRRDPTTGRSAKDEYARWGIYCTDGDRRDRGYDITKTYFKRDMICIHPRCKNLIYQLKNLQRGDKTGDDAPDALRYLCTYIYDTVFSGNLFSLEKTDQAVSQKVYPAYTRELNYFDTNIFPQENKRQDSWVLEECLND